MTAARGDVSGQGAADLSFRANVGDVVALMGTSMYAKSDDAVIVYGITYQTGDKVFNQFVFNLEVHTGAVMPNPDINDGIPPLNQKSPFQITVLQSNKRVMNTLLYILNSSGEHQTLYGYYYWDYAITVS